MKKFWLRLFDEGAGGEGVSGPAAGNEVSAEGAPDGEPEASVDTTPERKSFKDLVKGDYKQEADEYIQGIIRKRVGDSKKDKDTIASQNEILSIVASKYGLDTSDLGKLKEAVGNDDAYYEDKAYEEGLTVDQYKRIAQAEAKSKAYEAQIAAQQRDAEVQNQLAKWEEEEASVKQNFPDFDLQTELQNETFKKQIRLGIDMQSAYVAAHQAEILQGAMQTTAQAVRKATADDIAARGTRPRENASRGSAAATVRTDVSKLTRADREALSRRAQAGEIITL